MIGPPASQQINTPLNNDSLSHFLLENNDSPSYYLITNNDWYWQIMTPLSHKQWLLSYHTNSGIVDVNCGNRIYIDLLVLFKTFYEGGSDYLQLCGRPCRDWLQYLGNGIPVKSFHDFIVRRISSKMRWQGTSFHVVAWTSMNVADMIYSALCIDDYHSGTTQVSLFTICFYSVRIRSLAKITFDVLKWNVNSCLLLAVFWYHFIHESQLRTLILQRSEC